MATGAGCSRRISASSIDRDRATQSGRANRAFFRRAGPRRARNSAGRRREHVARRVKNFLIIIQKLFRRAGSRAFDKVRYFALAEKRSEGAS